MTVLPLVAGPATRVASGRRRTWIVVAGVGALMALAFVVRLRLITHGAGIAASDGYDDGVYYAAADALIHGRMPYRDFLLLHPPGVVIALTPFAALGALLGDPVGVTAGRLAFIGVGAVSTGLMALIALRHSRVAAVVAGLSAAVFFPLAYTERSTLLEPLGTALLLAAMLVLARAAPRRAPVIAGLVAGCAVDMRIWYALPVLLLGLLATPQRRAFLASAAASASAIALPFLLSAPVDMVREVVLDQAGRPSSASVAAVVHRLVAIGSAPKVTPGHHPAIVAALVLLVVAVAAVGAWRVRWARVAVVLAVATSCVLLVSPSFFLHYVAFPAPWMLLVLGVGVGEWARRIRWRSLRVVAVALPIVLVLGANVPSDLVSTVRPQPAAALAAAMRGRTGCIVSDEPGLLANAGLLSPALARGCPLWPDVTGWTYDRDSLTVGSRAMPRAQNPVWQRDLMRYLTSADYVVLDRSATGLSAANRAELAESLVVARAGRLVVYEIRE